MLILLLPDFIGQDFLDDTGSSRGKALQEVGAKREHKNLFVMEHPALLEQVHEAGDAGLIEAFKITSHWAHYRQPLSKSQECLRWVGKVKSWSVQGFFLGHAVPEKQGSEGERGDGKRNIDQHRWWQY